MIAYECSSVTCVMGLSFDNFLCISFNCQDIALVFLVYYIYNDYISMRGEDSSNEYALHEPG
jgi:hypothetical protein